jgi:hypothetical protein
MDLRHTHLLEMISCGIPQVSKECLNALTNLTNTLAAGRAPRDIAPWLCGASLAALSKRSGGVRPIAVVNVIRRLLAKCLVQVTNEQARAFFASLQLGVSVRSRVEVNYSRLSSHGRCAPLRTILWASTIGFLKCLQFDQSRGVRPGGL